MSGRGGRTNVRRAERELGGLRRRLFRFSCSSSLRPKLARPLFSRPAAAGHRQAQALCAGTACHRVAHRHRVPVPHCHSESEPFSVDLGPRLASPALPRPSPASPCARFRVRAAPCRQCGPLAWPACACFRRRTRTCTCFPRTFLVLSARLFARSYGQSRATHSLQCLPDSLYCSSTLLLSRREPMVAQSLGLLAAGHEQLDPLSPRADGC